MKRKNLHDANLMMDFFFNGETNPKEVTLKLPARSSL